MLSSETVVLVVALAPKLPAFRQMQLAHCSLRLTAARQFMVRCRWRSRCVVWHHNIDRVSYWWELPSRCPDGVCMATRLDGALCVRTYYLCGKSHGTYMEWYASGQLHEQYDMVGDRKHGAYTRWYESGTLEERGEYVDGKRHGAHEGWYVNAQLWSRGMYVDGKAHGECLTWYEDGSPCTRCAYINGHQHGEYQTFGYTTRD